MRPTPLGTPTSIPIGPDIPLVFALPRGLQLPRAAILGMAVCWVENLGVRLNSSSS